HDPLLLLRLLDPRLPSIHWRTSQRPRDHLAPRLSIPYYASDRNCLRINLIGALVRVQALQSGLLIVDVRLPLLGHPPRRSAGAELQLQLQRQVAHAGRRDPPAVDEAKDERPRLRRAGFVWRDQDLGERLNEYPFRRPRPSTSQRSSSAST